jgi:arsenate reductase
MSFAQGEDMTTADHSEDLSVDQQLALRSAAGRLSEEFAGVHDLKTVQSSLSTSYEQLATHSAFDQFLPLLAERFARLRLAALARVQGLRHDVRPIVVFLSAHDAGRSQMALGYLNRATTERVIGWSGGVAPAKEVYPSAVAAMAEQGIDISNEHPKLFDDEVLRAADVVVAMGCGDACPVPPDKRYEDWPVDDPAGKTLDEVRPIRDEIERRVRQLLVELEIPVAA